MIKITSKYTFFYISKHFLKNEFIYDFSTIIMVKNFNMNFIFFDEVVGLIAKSMTNIFLHKLTKNRKSVHSFFLLTENLR